MKTSIKNIKERIRNSIKESIKVAVIALAITLGITYAYAAWTGPTATPPNNNVNAPINVGAVDQIKNAGLGVNSFSVFGNSNLGGYVKIGATTATCDTSIEGSLRFGTNSDNNKCLQLCVGSDWQDVSCEPLTFKYVWGYGDGTVASVGNDVYKDSIWSCNNSSSAACQNAELYCRNGWSWTWTCTKRFSDGTGVNVNDSFCGGVNPSTWTCNP